MSSLSRITAFFRPFTTTSQPESTIAVEQQSERLSNLTSANQSDDQSQSRVTVDAAAVEEESHMSACDRSLRLTAPTTDQRGLQAFDGTAMSDIPKASQPNTTGSSFSSSASRRVVVGNVKAVTNSDSEGLSDSSDDGLVDLDELISRKRRKLTPPIGSSARPFVIADAPAKASSTGRPRPAKPSYRHSLKSIVAQHQEDTAIENRIHVSEAILTAQQDALEHPPNVDEIADAVLSDESENERFKAALHRVDAGDGEIDFHFFRQPAVKQRGLDFPSNHIPAELQGICKQSQRQAFFTSGLAADIAQMRGLPDQLVVWVHDQLLYEESTLVCDSYLSVLAAIYSRGTSSTASERCLLSCGYHGQTCLDSPSGHNFKLPASLKYVLRAQRLCAGRLSNGQRITAIVELILLNTDAQVGNSLELRRDIDATLGALLRIPEEVDCEGIFVPVIERVLNATTLSQQQLYRSLATIPAGCASLRKFRRLLAMHCILAADATDSIDITSADCAVRLLVKLKRDARFNVRTITDWTTFQALVYVLDVAVADGFSDFAFLTAQGRTMGKRQSILSTKSTVSPAETEFNQQIDSICDRLQLMLNNIKDGGTDSLNRTTAKYALEALCIRLRACTRTRSKAPIGVFGDAVNTKQRNFLENFLSESNHGLHSVDEHNDEKT